VYVIWFVMRLLYSRLVKVDKFLTVQRKRLRDHCKWCMGEAKSRILLAMCRREWIWMVHAF
jgi:hypothetical protein